MPYRVHPPIYCPTLGHPKLVEATDDEPNGDGWCPTEQDALTVWHAWLKARREQLLSELAFVEYAMDRGVGK